MRTIPTAFQTHLNGDVLTLALCVKLTRADGTVLAFTGHDEDIRFDGLLYEAGACADPSAMRNELGGAVGNLDIMGLLDSDFLTEADVIAGLYQGCTIDFYNVNWSAAKPRTSTNDGYIIARGFIGEITLGDAGYTAEVRFLWQLLQQQIVEVTSPTCRAQVYDSRCGVNPAAFTFSRTVNAVTDRYTCIFAADAHATGYFDQGWVTFTSGANAGIEREVKRHTLSGGSSTITVQDPWPYDVAVSDVANLIKGCNRAFSTCVSDFANGVNFRGEPHLPGNDKVLKLGRR